MARLPGRRFARALRVSAKVILWVVAGLLVLAVAAVLALNLAPARRQVALRTTSLLADAFHGSLVVEEIDHISPFEVRVRSARMLDEQGRQAVQARGVTARVSAFDIVRSVVFGDGDIQVHLREVTIDHVDLSLDDDGTDLPRVARAFEPKESTDTPAPDESPGRGVTLNGSDLRVRHVWVHGKMSGVPLIDADVDHLRATLRVDPGGVAVRLSRADVTTRSLPREANLRGEVGVAIGVPAGDEAPLWIDGRFDGSAGGVPVTLVAELRDEKVKAELVVPKTAGAIVRRLVPELDGGGDAAAHLRIDGPLAGLGFHAEATIGPGALVVHGKAALTGSMKVSAHLEVTDVDLSAIGRALPSSSLAATADASLELPAGGDPAGTFEVQLAAGWVDAQPIPAASLRGTVERNQVRVRGTIDEPGAPTEVDVLLHSPERGWVVDADVTASVPDLRRVARVGPLARGHAQVRARVTLDLGAETLSGHASATAGDVVYAPATVARAEVVARVSGPLVSPRLEARLRADRLTVEGRTWTRASATAAGGLQGARVHVALEGAHGTPDVRAETALEIGNELVLRDTTVSVQRANDEVTARSPRIALGDGVKVDRLSLTGSAGELAASVRMAAGAAALTAKGHDLDLGVLARVAGHPEVVQGRLDLDVDLVARGAASRGRVDLELEGVTVGKLQDASVRVHATLEKRLLSSTVHALLGPGHVDVTASDVHLDGSPFDAASWKRAYGSIEVSADVDLERVRALLPADALPFDELTGHLVATATATRDAPDGIPRVEASVRTRKLHVAGRVAPAERVDGSLVRGPPPWRSTEIDVVAEGKVDGVGATELHVTALDGQGQALVVASLEGKVPYRELAGGGISLDRVDDIPFSARVQIPRRRIDAFPSVLRVRQAKGSVDLLVSVDGTLAAPVVALEGHATGLELRRRRAAVPLGARAEGHFRDGKGSVELEVERDGVHSLGASAQFSVDPRELLNRVPSPRWEGSAKVDLRRFPLRAVPALEDRGIRGQLEGKLVARGGSRRHPEIELELDGDRIAIGGGRRRNQLRVRAKLDSDSLDANVSIAQGVGFAKASAHVDLAWKAGAIPEPRKARVRIDAKDFRLAIFAPLLDEFVKEVDGRLDGEVSLDVDAVGPRMGLRGSLALEDGVFQLPTVGEEFRNGKIHLTFESGGIVRATRISAEGATGRFSGNAVARFAGFNLVGARAEVHIPKRTPLPVVVEGETLAEAWTDLTVDVKPNAKSDGLDVTVRVPAAGIELPRRSAHAVQNLSPAKSIRIGVYRTPEEFLILPLGPKQEPKEASPGNRLRVTTDLGRIEVSRKGELRLQLSGRLEIEPADPTRVQGHIRIQSGFIDVQGKRFEIEQGTVTFLGDPNNPEVVVTAGWTAPEGTRVYADFVGPLETGRLTLRSEPTHTKSEILSLILFGSADGGTPGEGSGSAGTQAAVGFGGGVATQGLNRALDDLTGLEITTRVDTTSSANPRPEVEVRIARDISLALSHALGVPPPGTRPDKNFATVDWRFKPNWSLETTFGDAGSSILDVIWQYRY